MGLRRKPKVTNITSLGDKKAPNARSAKGTKNMSSSPGNAMLGKVGGGQGGFNVSLPKVRVGGGKGRQALDEFSASSDKFQQSKAGQKMQKRVAKRLDKAERRNK